MNLEVLTISQLAEELADRVDRERPYRSERINCDFAIVDQDVDITDVQRIYEDASGWHGIKSIKAGFDTENLCVLADYYGGGCDQYFSIYPGEGSVEVVNAFHRAILDTLAVQECVTKNTLLIAEMY